MKWKPPSSLQKKFMIDFATPEDFVMTRPASGTYHRRDGGVHDESTYGKLRAAMITMGFDVEEQFDIFEIVSAVQPTPFTASRSCVPTHIELCPTPDKSFGRVSGLDSSYPFRRLLYAVEIPSLSLHSNTLTSSPSPNTEGVSMRDPIVQGCIH